MEPNAARMESILCSPNYEIYRSQDGWCFIRYTEEGTGRKFNASGENLPSDKKLLVKLSGNWKISRRDGSKVFDVSFFEIPKQTNKENIISYLRSMKCRIGYKKAAQIYETFGEDTWDIIEERPWELTCIDGISDKTVEAVVRAKKNSGQLHDAASMCAEANADIPLYILQKVIDDYGDRTVETIRDNPYILTDYKISFEKADAVGLSLGLPKNYQPRLEAGVNCLFSRAAVSGHSCLPKMDVTVQGKKSRGIICQMMQLLNCTEEDSKVTVNRMFRAGKLKYSAGCLFTEESYSEEESIAADIKRLLLAEHCEIGHLDNIIDDYEAENFKLADSQRAAVKMVFRSQVSVITGGPGTGKTTVIKAILYVHQQVFGASSEPVLLAPTGKAARRMAEATEHPAMTVHSAIGYRGDSVPAKEDVAPGGNLIIIDESSMLDQKICACLLSKIKTGAKVVFVGDINQLPSVGAGNVLKDIIESSVIPTTMLSVIFRQQGESPIITNSAKMNAGDTDLVYTSTFCFFDTPSEEETFQKTQEVYLKCIRKYGIANVILLNPQRRNTLLSVGEFNKKLQETLHTSEYSKYLDISDCEDDLSIRIGGMEFRPGDRIMQMKNTEIASNGDIGIIRRIAKYPNPDEPGSWLYNAYIEFNDDGKLYEYNIDMMREIDLAYAMSVHKAQGSEYACVIEVVSSSHPMMLRRQILYTGVTRAKKYVYLVGQIEALNKAILDGTPVFRYTSLKGRLQLIEKSI